MANTTHMSAALKIHIIMWEAFKRLEIGLLQAVIPSFPFGPLFLGLGHTGKDLALPFCAPSPPPPPPPQVSLSLTSEGNTIS